MRNFLAAGRQLFYAALQKEIKKRAFVKNTRFLLLSFHFDKSWLWIWIKSESKEKSYENKTNANHNRNSL